MSNFEKPELNPDGKWTPKADLALPDRTDNVRVADLNYNFQKIDADFIWNGGGLIGDRGDKKSINCLSFVPSKEVLNRDHVVASTDTVYSRGGISFSKDVHTRIDQNSHISVNGDEDTTLKFGAGRYSFCTRYTSAYWKHESGSTLYDIVSSENWSGIQLPYGSFDRYTGTYLSSHELYLGIGDSRPAVSAVFGDEHNDSYVYIGTGLQSKRELHMMGNSNEFSMHGRSDVNIGLGASGNTLQVHGDGSRIICGTEDSAGATVKIQGNSPMLICGTANSRSAFVNLQGTTASLKIGEFTFTANGNALSLTKDDDSTGITDIYALLKTLQNQP